MPSHLMDEDRPEGRGQMSGFSFSSKETEAMLRSMNCPNNKWWSLDSKSGFLAPNHPLLAKSVFFPIFLIQSHL